MEELIKLAYINFSSETNEKSKNERSLIDKRWERFDSELDKLKEILSEKLYENICEKMVDHVCKIEESAFIAGFAYCAKFLTNGKTDLFPND